MHKSPYQAVFFTGADEGLAKRSQRFRRILFVDRCGWDLRVSGDREVDQFDRIDTVHAILIRGDQICGTFRAIRTDRPYLAREVFPQLALVSPYPSRPDMWEISRFGVLGDGDTRHLARTNYALMFWFAGRVGASGLVAIADLAYERFLRGLGIRTRRYGPPQVIGADRTGRALRVVAGEIPLAAQDNARMADLSFLLDDVEITDASEIFGPARISA